MADTLPKSSRWHQLLSLKFNSPCPAKTPASIVSLTRRIWRWTVGSHHSLKLHASLTLAATCSLQPLSNAIMKFRMTNLDYVSQPPLALTPPVPRQLRNLSRVIPTARCFIRPSRSDDLVIKMCSNIIKWPHMPSKAQVRAEYQS